MKRRKFIKNVSALASALAMPTIIPASALGLGGAVAPSERVNMGFIGLGGMGLANLKNFASDKRVNVAAFCDVNFSDTPKYSYSHNMRYGMLEARSRFPNVKCHSDFRELLENKSIDAVCNSTPDHWHAIIGSCAVKAGKDVYGEKPLTRTIGEGKALRDIVARSGRIWQTGSWRRSLPQFQYAARLIRNGDLGRVKLVKIGLPSNEEIAPLPAAEIPDGFNWDFWLGPAPKAAYHPYRAFTTWRYISDYSCGKIGDWGAHFLDFARWSLDLDPTGAKCIIPLEVKYPQDGFFDNPTVFTVRYEYANSVAVEMSNTYKLGIEFYGTKGDLFIYDKAVIANPHGLSSKALLQNEKTEQIFKTPPDVKHWGAFVDSVLTRRKASTDVEIAHRTNTDCLLGEIACSLGRAIEWNASAENFVRPLGREIYVQTRPLAIRVWLIRSTAGNLRFARRYFCGRAISTKKVVFFC